MNATQETITGNMKASESVMEAKKKEEAVEVEQPPKNIHEAMLRVYDNIGYVQKKGKISSGNINYKFAGEAEFIAAIRPQMILAGIYQSPLKMDIITNERLETIKVWDGKETKTYQHRVVIHVDYKLHHAASDTHIVIPAFGEAMDSGDKAFNKAMTAANKYAIRQAFMIETGDDPDKYPSKEDGGVDDKPERKESAVARNKRFKNTLAEINACEDMTSLQHVWQHEQPSILGFKAEDETFYDELVKAKDARKKAIADKEVSELAAPTLEY